MRWRGDRRQCEKGSEEGLSVGRVRSPGPAKENMRRIPDRAWHHGKWANQPTNQPINQRNTHKTDSEKDVVER